MRVHPPSIVLSPTPLSFLCALIFYLSLAIVFTIITPPGPTRPLSALPRAVKTLQKLHNETNTTISSSSSSSSSSTSPAQAIYGGAAYNETHDDVEDNSLSQLAGRVNPPAYNETTDDDVEDNSLFQLAGRVNPPSYNETTDDDDDEDNSLFQLVNPNPEPPTKKLAFMFLTTTPLPFAALWELFFNNTPKNLYNIYIHADPSFNYTPPFSGVFAHRVIPSKPTRRNSPTLISAARRLLSGALLHDKSNYMFAVLSSSCIPLHSFNFTFRILTKSENSFIEILKDEPGAYARWAARGKDVMVPEVKFEEFRIGSQFFVLKRKHARIVVRDSRLWSKFKLPCLRLNTCYPEEQYFPTLLRMVDPRGCVPATLTHVDWRGRRDGHPRTYQKAEVGPELIRALRKGKPRYGSEGSNVSDSSVTRRRDSFLFARKFSPDSIEPLMDIANDVILKD